MLTILAILIFQNPVFSANLHASALHYSSFTPTMSLAVLRRAPSALSCLRGESCARVVLGSNLKYQASFALRSIRFGWGESHHLDVCITAQHITCLDLARHDCARRRAQDIFPLRSCILFTLSLTLSKHEPPSLPSYLHSLPLPSTTTHPQPRPSIPSLA
ncbi:hypothetical protein P154DRAFT_269707 [Amniculicola lignicola CBS 123094]|uniref:Uncharacterized protein n=1 Tax=Amniculicola lignicola CBS 123094 TaxID=1392246 RepID=A0A6A5WCM6_9PLEO|nr:hypothetical protein P154DRAFT_269707 [Amniculicola lignicola CBS 123094]